jgi:hypothetical protein
MEKMSSSFFWAQIKNTSIAIFFEIYPDSQ